MEIEGPLIFSYLKLSMPFLSFFFHLPGIWFGVDYQRSHHFQEAYIEWVKAKRKISKISFYSCMVHALNGDYSTESAHKRFLFTSCDASKKKTNKWAKRSVENFVASQPVNKNRSNAFHMVWCFSFHTYWDFFHISIQRLEANDCENTSVPKLWHKRFRCWWQFLPNREL